MIKYAGIEFKNSFIVASSPLTKSIVILKKADEAGAAGVSIKLTFIKQPFYGKLRMYNQLKHDSIVCYDRRLDIEEGLELSRRAKKETDLKVFANITSDTGDLKSWERLAIEYEKAGADLIEANLICPNVGLFTKSISGDGAVDQMEKGGAVTGQDPIRVREIISTLKKFVNIPVIAKLTPNVTDIKYYSKSCTGSWG